MTPPAKQPVESRTPLAVAGAVGLVVLCCGGHALLLGALGSVALGGVFGIGAGVLAALLFAVAFVGIRRRRLASLAPEFDRSQHR